MGNLHVYVLSGIISALVAGIISLLIMLLNNRFFKESQFTEHLFAIQKMSFKNVFLEDIIFTKNWLKIRKEGKQKQKILMYDVYCEMVFNFLSELAKFCHYNKIMMDIHINVRDWVRTHKEWWENPVIENSNIDTYDKRFKKLIKEYLE